MERNGSNVTQAVYTEALGYAGGIGGLISQTRSAVTTWYHYIHNGTTNVSHLTNSAGVLVQRYDFDAFGNSTYSSGSTVNNYRFQTKELNAKSNLIFFGSRWYNPAIGRWMTPDPLGFIDGPNPYTYLNNNPLNLVDAWGLCGGFWNKVGDWLGKVVKSAIQPLKTFVNVLTLGSLGMLFAPPPYDVAGVVGLAAAGYLGAAVDIADAAVSGNPNKAIFALGGLAAGYGAGRLALEATGMSATTYSWAASRFRSPATGQFISNVVGRASSAIEGAAGSIAGSIGSIVNSFSNNNN